MNKLTEMTRWLDEELKIKEIPDYSGAMNGLQLENKGDVEVVIAAVDSSLSVVRKALKIANGRPALMVVHHGLFWQGAQRYTGATYAKIHEAMMGNLAIYAAHLPLDIHPVHGNNMLLAQEIGIQNLALCMPSKYGMMGLMGDWCGTREELEQKIVGAVQGKVHTCPAGPEKISRVIVVTGGAGAEVELASDENADAFITGEGPHWSYGIAEDLGVNVFYGGHYATEVFGVKSISLELSKRFGVEVHFVAHPTGL